jgi:hypothetical protein
VPEAGLAQLDSNLPHSGFEYVDGGLWEAGKLRRVEVRYRGDNVYHWGYFKKSWRVKTKKGTLYDGMRKFNLIAPITAEIVNNHLSYRLAASMGLVSPRSELVNVIVNGSRTGVHILTEQLTEITLRRHGLMPGDLYSGEAYGREAYRGVRNKLFRHPGLWEKVAVNNHYDESSFAPLERLIALVSVPQNEAVQEQLANLVDLEAFGRFSALEILLATAHYDTVHNWRLYYDPWRQKFVPVVWDPVGWYVERLPPQGRTARLDVITTPFHAALHRNGEFLRARQRALEEFFDAGGDVALLQDLDRAVEALDVAVGQDPNLVALEAVQTAAAVRAAMAKMRAAIGKLFREIRAGYVAEPSTVVYSWEPGEATLAIRVTGRQPVDRLILRYAKALGNVASAGIRFWRDGEVIERDLSGVLTQAGRELELQFSLLSQFVPVLLTMGAGQIENHLEVKPGYYELVLRGIDPEANLLEVLAGRGGDQLGQGVRVESLERSGLDGMYSVVAELPVREPVTLEGEVVVDRVMEIDDHVIIAPGTTVRLEPGASVIFRGPVWAEGTAEEPIRFLPAKPGQDPWGVLALQGPAAAGSVFRHCEFIGGSGLKGDLFEYSAMLSIHDVDGVTVEHCKFADSKIVDDMVHAVYARVRFSDCEFSRAFGDALDLDISEGIVERCLFRDSVNDALDLMTSRVVVLDSTMQGNGDKGISVGEDTRLLAIGCRFEGNHIGVESKDRSVAVLYNADLLGNGLALNAYDKNWQYEGGGFTYLYKSRMLDNEIAIDAAKDSAIWVHDTYIDRPLDPDARRIEADETVDSDPGVTARVRSLWRFPGERDRLGGFAEKYWTRANPAARGAASIPR